jgi:hypothetical protein
VTGVLVTSMQHTPLQDHTFWPAEGCSRVVTNSWGMTNIDTIIKKACCKLTSWYLKVTSGCRTFAILLPCLLRFFTVV